MNHRQLNLHNIIKQQQAKISQLREQLGLVTQLSESHLIDWEKKTLDAVKEKEEMLEYMREELDVEKTKCIERQQKIMQLEEKLAKKLQHEDDYQQTKQLNQRLAQRNTQLQNRLQHATQTYEKKLSLLQRENKHLSQQSALKINESKLIESQIDKLTKYYKASMFQIPKRKQTLLWVDNLIKYMEVWDKGNTQKYEQLFDQVKDKLNEVRQQVIKSVQQTSLNDQKISANMQTLYKEFKQFYQEKIQYESALQSGIDETLLLVKKEKQYQQRSQLETLRQSLSQLQTQSAEIKSTLQKRIKQLQNEKKTLVLGFQQIKTFLENKQTNYKEEIASLKQTITDLLEANDLRQKQFEEEIRLLSAQIETISNRYYQNIEYPVSKINEKVERELNKVKSQLLKLSQEHAFKQELVGLSERINKFSSSMEEEKQFVAIQLCMKKGNQLLISIRQLMSEMNEKRSERKSIERNSIYSASGKKTSSKQIDNQPRYSQKRQPTTNKRSQTPLTKSYHNRKQQQSSSSKKPAPAKQLSFNESQPLFQPVIQGEIIDDMQLQQLNELKSAVSQIQSKQRQNKYLYEINLLKKHNHKLNEHILSLEKKFKNLAANKFIDEKQITNYFKTEKKIIEIETQNEQLKETHAGYETLIKNQIHKIFKKIQTIKKDLKTTNKQQASIIEALMQLNQRHETISQILRLRNEKMTELQNSTKLINSLLIKPQQTFQSLIRQFTMQLSSLTTLNNQQTTRTFPGGQFSSIAYSNISHKSRLSINQTTIKQYQDILTRRNEINSSATKYISELIRTLRQTFPIRDNKRKDLDNSNLQKENLPGKGQSSKTAKTTLIQKKLKQLSTQQTKYKQQITSKVDKLLETLQSLQSRQQKNSKLNQNKQRKIEQLLEKYFTKIMQEIKYSLEKERRQQSTLNIEALKDTVSKLKQSLRQNEGLKKELDVLYLLSKGTALKPTDNENFYS